MIKIRVTDNSLRPIFVFVIAASLGACNGGLVGSGTGPKIEGLYQMRSLPEKTSPSLPKTIIDSEKLNNSFDTSEKSRINQRSLIPSHDSTASGGAIGETRAQSWSLLIEKMTNTLQQNLKSQEILALVDSRFQTILSLCEDQNVQYALSDCTIKPNRVSATYTQQIVNLIVKQHDASHVSENNENISLQTVKDQYQELVGNTVELGTIIYNPQTLGAYDQYLAVSNIADPRFSNDYIFKWTNDKSIIEINITNDSQATIIKYQSNQPSEKLVVTRLGANDDSDSIFNASITSTDELTNEVLIDAQYITSEYTLSTQSRITNTSGFSFTQYTQLNQDPGTSAEAISVNQEFFESDGALVAYGECTINTSDDQCLTDDSFTGISGITGLLTDSPEYFSLMEFPTLLNNSGVSSWKVVNMPTDIKEFLVVTNESLNSDTYLDILCFGTQQTPGDPQLHCAAPDASFEDTSVVYFDDRVIDSLDGENGPTTIKGAMITPVN